MEKLPPSTFVTAAVSAMLARTRKYGRPSFTSSTCIHALDVWHMFFILSIPTPYGISAGIPSKTSILACSPVALVSSTLRTSAPIFSPGSVKYVTFAFTPSTSFSSSIFNPFMAISMRCVWFSSAKSSVTFPSFFTKVRNPVVFTFWYA